MPSQTLAPGTQLVEDGGSKVVHLSCPAGQARTKDRTVNIPTMVRLEWIQRVVEYPIVDTFGT